MAATSTKLHPDDLMHSMVLLTPADLSEFVLHFDEWRFRQAVQADSEATQIAETHRLPAAEPERMVELLAKNREEGLSSAEEAAIDGYLVAMDCLRQL